MLVHLENGVGRGGSALKETPRWATSLSQVEQVCHMLDTQDTGLSPEGSSIFLGQTASRRLPDFSHP